MERLILLVIFTCSFTRILSLDYSDLEALGVACNPRDTCCSNQNRSLLVTNCECDNRCVSFGDCCINARVTRRYNRAQRHLGLSCLPILGEQGVYEIRKCKSSWNESFEVRSKCENQDDLNDPFLSLPFTDTRTNMTYRNRYCAECNNASLTNLLLWDLRVTCSSLVELNQLYNNITRDLIQENITRVGHSWGVYQWNANLEDMEFYPCEISVHLPQNLKPHVRYCRPNIISTCSTNYSRARVRRYCEQYMAVIYIDGQGYRNAHCALCNYVSFNNRQCTAPVYPVPRRRPSLTFSRLLDLNQIGGDDVDSNNSCSTGEKYDPFLKKCRPLICPIPGQIVGGDRCVSLLYSDLRMMGVSCSPGDTCSSNLNRTFSKTNCECDNWCVSFDDCCIDASAMRNYNRVQKRLDITCLPIFPDQGAYGIRKCKSSWNESLEVRTKCENDDYLSDPFLSVPFTDTRTNVTYSNRYCAKCNDASLTNLSVWDLTVHCSSLVKLYQLYGNITRDFIHEHITRTGHSWGVYQWNATLEDMEFYPCDISFHLPHNLKPHVRYCRPNVISTCSPNYTRDRVRRYCEQYMAVIYIDDQGYRNAHCALCNYISFNNSQCSVPMDTTSRGPSMSFTLLLDINQRGGDDVGSNNSCSSGEKYDPFFKKCRPVICAIPGQIMRGDRCVFS